MYILADIKRNFRKLRFILEQRRLLIFSDIIFSSQFFYVKYFIFNKYICEIHIWKTLNEIVENQHFKNKKMFFFLM